MLSAIQSGYKNNNIQNHINFEGKGKLVGLKKYRLNKYFYYSLLNADSAVSHEAPSAKPVDPNILHVFTPIARFLETSIDELKKVWSNINFAEVSANVLALKEFCHTKKQRQAFNVKSFVAQLPWENKDPRQVRSFESEVLRYFKQLGIVTKGGAFAGVPAKTVTVVSGNEVVPQDLGKIANLVVIKGGKLGKTKFNNVLVEGVDDASLRINARGGVNISHSTVGEAQGRRVDLTDSEVKGFVATQKPLFVMGETTIGSVKSCDFLSCESGSRVRVRKNVDSRCIGLEEDSTLEVKGRIGQRKKKIERIYIGKNSVKAKSLHAKELIKAKDSKITAEVSDIENTRLD